MIKEYSIQGIHYTDKHGKTPIGRIRDIMNDISDDIEKYTYVILGKPGPTGKSYLWRSLQDMGIYAFELGEQLANSLLYYDGYNHYFVNRETQTMVVVLNHLLDESIWRK